MMTAPAALMAQEVPVESADDGDAKSTDIVVVATRYAGQVDTDIPPVLTLDEADITSYGASSIAELLDALAPQTGSGRGRGGGRPVILLNGQRISSFREMRSIPPEAIRRMEVLPEEVALRFGYPAEQRVVNFILKDNFSSKQIAGEFNMPTRGGYTNWELEGGRLRIDGPSRMNLEAKIVDTSLLTEAERGIIQDDSELARLLVGVDPGKYRSLAPENREITLNGTWSTGLGDEGMGGTLSANGAYTRTDTRSLTGLDGLLLAGSDQTLRALERNTATDLFQGGLALNKPLGDWLMTLTGDASYSEATTLSDLPGGIEAGRAEAQSKDMSLSSLATLAGRPFSLPAGDASLTVKAGFDFDRSDNSNTRGAAGNTVLKRGDASAGANLSLPITSRKNDVLAGIGDLSLNASAGVNHLSDFGTLNDWSAGLTWKPTEKLTLQASYLVKDAAPTLSQLGAPQIVTFNVPVYDFTRGEAALVTVTSGGNPALLAEKQRDWKISANWDLPIFDRSNLLVEYFRNSSSDVSQSFPLLTPAIEAAFPDRVTRDASGQLIAIDRRPVTFDKVESSRIRWGFNISGRLTKESEQGDAPESPPARTEPAQTPPPERGEGRPAFDPQRFQQMKTLMCGDTPPDPAALPERMRERLTGADGKIDEARLAQLRERICNSDGPPARAAPAGENAAPASGGSRAGGGAMPFGRGGPPVGRWNLSVYHTYRLTDRVTIAEGGPVLDQLAGDAISAGGVPRHEVTFEGGLFNKGTGLRLSGTWAAPATVKASGAPGTSDLRFGSTFVVNARFFLNLGQRESLVEKVPFLKGTRIALTVDNIFDSRQKVTDEDGLIPLAYQRAYREPQGRVLGIDIRKMF
ncbi:MAG: TonB-dependent receptor [Novosphingobium sp.]|nr:TonB-dependent receptor [Novosphingobium sp.]